MDCERTFRNLLEDIAKEHGYEDPIINVTPIDSGGSNYTSTLFTATISAPDKEEIHLFGKVANIGEKLREEFPVVLFEIERIAYQELAKTYEKIESKYNIPEEDRLVLSKYYGSNANELEETVVLENLNAKGFTLHNRLKSVDWPYASKAVEVLARLHALSMALAKDYPDKFERHSEKLSSLKQPLCEGFNRAITLLLPLSLAAVKEENKDRLKTFFDNKDKVDFALMYKTMRKPVLVHADYRPSNLMHRNNEDGSVDMIPVDLQSIQPSSAVVDLIYFIFTGTDQAFREQYYSQLIEHYYSSLSRLLRSYGLDPDKIYSRDDFDYEFQERLHFGLVIAVMTLPLVTVETEDAPVMEEMTTLDNFTINTGNLFPKRLNEVVDNFVRWGIL